MEIAVQEFSGYSSRDNNHIYDLVVSLRIMKTETDARTPNVIVIAGVQHMLERALVLQGLALLGHPGAAAFEVVVHHVGGLIDATRDEMAEKLNLARAENKKLTYGLEASLSNLRIAKRSIDTLRDEKVALKADIEVLRDDLDFRSER